MCFFTTEFRRTDFLGFCEEPGEEACAATSPRPAEEAEELGLELEPPCCCCASRGERRGAGEVVRLDI